MNETTLNTETQLEKLDILSFLNDYLLRLRRLWWVVVVLVALSMGLNYYRVSTSYSPSYVAEATVSVVPLFFSDIFLHRAIREK